MQDNNIPLFKVFMPPKEILIQRLSDVLYSGQISEGPPVVEFEEAFSKKFSVPNVLSFYSGTAALHTALILAGVKHGDEVISTAMTAEPTNMSILHAGGRIVWADVDPKNGNISPESIEAKISPRTRAIMVVHYGGIPASLNAIKDIAESHSIPIIEDVAHALGARYNEHMLGSHSDYAIYSFQAIKHMTTVDGGMLSCKDPEKIELGRKIRWFGIDRRQSRTEVDVKNIGYKYHMNNINATIGLVQLEYIESIIKRYIENGEFFNVRLKNMAGIELCEWDALAKPSYWFYTILSRNREKLAKYLSSHNIENSQVHKRNDHHSIFKKSQCQLPGLDLFYSQMLHIPCGWWLSNNEREYIVDIIEQICR